MQFVRYLAFVAFAAIPFGGCSSSDDTSPGTGTPDNTPDERRVSLGKADSLSGKCSASGHSYCGGKSKGKCWCDAACAQYGDCCTDYSTSCGSSGAKKCKTSAECASGQYCQAAEGCAAEGVCKPKPTNVPCLQVLTPYCTCEGETKVANTSCIYDRFAHKGACETPPASCGGFANLPCPTGQICVENPNDGCDPANGGADCPGMCIAKKTCGGIANLPCPTGNECVDDPTDSCDPGNGGADCSGVCVPKTTPPAAKNTCSGHCGGPSDDKSCYCDAACTKYGDCCADYAKFCDVRTPATGACVKNSNDACASDADCKGGGCGGELCYNPAVSSGISTCECSAPSNVKGCGCVSGKCTWYN
ncbi:MAG: hypothetical protein U0263_04380 [Polyangiaceae bacterium]